MSDANRIKTLEAENRFLQETVAQLLDEVAFCIRCKTAGEILAPHPEERWVRQACAKLGYSFADLTARTPTGHLSRLPHRTRARGHVCTYLRKSFATPCGGMSFPEIAKGFGMVQGAIVEIVRRYEQQYGEMTQEARAHG